MAYESFYWLLIVWIIVASKLRQILFKMWRMQQLAFLKSDFPQERKRRWVGMNVSHSSGLKRTIFLGVVYFHGQEGGKIGWRKDGKIIQKSGQSWTLQTTRCKGDSHNRRCSYHRPDNEASEVKRISAEEF